MKHSWKPVRFVVQIVVASAMFAGAAATQPLVEQRTLYGHTFPTTNNFEDPFLNTDVNLALGVGQAVDLEIPLFIDDAGTPAYIVEGDVAFLLVQLAYQQRILSWMSLGFQADVVARMGTTTASLIAEGGTAYYGPELFVKMRILEKPRFALSGKLAASKRSLYDISPLDWARDIIANDGIDSTSTLLSSSDGWRYQAGIAGVYVFSPRLGAKGFFIIRPGERLREEDIFDTPYGVGGALSWDANPFQWPIGLVGRLGYRTSSDLSSDVADNVLEYGLGIFYKGRNELVLGADFGWGRIDQKDADSTVDAVSTLLVMRYDF
jgi:hypothetical protein